MTFFTVMPAALAASVIALYRLCPDWERLQELPDSDDKRKVVHIVNTDSSRKKQSHAIVYAYKREKALGHASSRATRAACRPPAAVGLPADEADILDLGEPTAVRDGPPPSSAIESRLTKLEHQIHELVNTVTTLTTTTVGHIIVRNDEFCVGGITCTASHVQWEKRRRCGLVDCLLLWSNQSWSCEAVEEFHKRCAAYKGPCPQDEPREVRIWQQMYDSGADVLLVVAETGNQVQYRHLCRSPPREKGPVVYLDMHERAFLLSGQDLVEKLRTNTNASPAAPSSDPPPSTSSTAIPTAPSVIDLTAAPGRRTKRENADNTTGAPAAKKARHPPSAGDELVKWLTVEQTSLLPGGRCVLAAVCVALDKTIDLCRRELAKRLEQWTEPMWLRHVPARLRQHHWTSGRSSFHTYLELLGGGARLDQCVLYLASIEYEVSIHVVTARDAPLRLTMTQVHTGITYPRHIVLLHNTGDDHYEVVQHNGTTVFDKDKHKLLLHCLVELPTATLHPIADPEVDEPELDMGGYEKAPTVIGQGAFGRVYRVATKDPCAHPRWHALKIVSNDKHVAKMVKLEADALKKLADHPGVPRLWQLVGERALSIEYCVGGSLDKVMEKPLPVAVCMEVFRQLLCTISHAHKAGLLHRDIKPANILLRHKLLRISTIHDVDVVLADWGLATSDKGVKRGLAGTSRYLPPEVLSEEQPFDATCDVWAAGYVLAQLLRGGTPLFAGEITSKWQEQLEAKLSGISHDAIRKLLLAVLSPRSERPNASKVLLMLPSIVV